MGMFFYLLMTALVLCLHIYEARLMASGSAEDRFNESMAKARIQFGDKAERVMRNSYVTMGTILFVIWLMYHAMIIIMAHSAIVTFIGIFMILFAVYCYVMTLYIAERLEYKRPLFYTAVFLFETGYIFIMLLIFITGTIK